MQKLLILVTTIASLLTAACSQDPVVNRLPWVYRIEVQQGNVISQDAVDRLRPRMTRRQVQFVMGTPMIADPFHANRWDYVYLYDPGSGKGEPALERLTLFFEEDRLVRLSGTLHPDLTAGSDEGGRKQVMITVPPQEREEPGILTRLWRWMGFGSGDNAGHAH